MSRGKSEDKSDDGGGIMEMDKGFELFSIKVDREFEKGSFIFSESSQERKETIYVFNRKITKKTIDYVNKIKKECIICKEIFYSYHNMAIYCSRKCNQKAKRIRASKRLRICEYCQEIFMPLYGSLGKYCSRSCNYKDQIKKYFEKGIEANCAFCGKLFTKINIRHKHCSKKCSLLFNQEIHKTRYNKNYRKEITCPICNVKFSIIKGQPILCCSEKCKKEMERIQSKEYRKKASEQLRDSYIKDIFIHKTKLKPKDIPESLVEVYREYIKLKRLLGGRQNVKCDGNSGSSINTSQSIGNG